MSLLDGWRFCPRCGGPARAEEGCSVCTACGYAVWAAAIPSVQGVAIADDGRILLGRRARDPARGRWDIPGGFLDEGEDPIAALAREFLEETGLSVEPDAFLGIWTDRYGERFTLTPTWTVRVVGGEPAAGDDLDELRWFDATALPPLAFASHREVLEAAAAS